MSTLSGIAFPNPHDPHQQQAAQSHLPPAAAHIPFFPDAFDPAASASSFQTNPLSAHPPRTPRTSILASSASASGVGVGVYAADERVLADADGGDVGLDDDAAEAEEEEGGSAKRVRKEEVWRAVLATSTGRDKALKLIQYSMRVYVLFHRRLNGSRWGDARAASFFERALFQRLDATMAGLSLARKCLILFNWLAPLSTITAPQTLPFASSSSSSEKRHKAAAAAPFVHRFLHAPPPVLLDLVNGVADDVATLARLGLLGRGLGARADNLANWCWFSGTLVGLVEVGVEQGLVKNLIDEAEGRAYAASFGEGVGTSGGDEKELARLRRQYYWLQVSRAKLLMDLIFVSYECFQLKRARGAAMGLSGLCSAVLSTMKLYDRHRTSLMRT